MTGIAVILMALGGILFLIMPESFIVSVPMIVGGFALVALDQHNRDEKLPAWAPAPKANRQPRRKRGRKH